MDHPEFGSVACGLKGAEEEKPYDGDSKAEGGEHGHALGDAFFEVASVDKGEEERFADGGPPVVDGGEVGESECVLFLLFWSQLGYELVGTSVVLMGEAVVYGDERGGGEDVEDEDEEGEPEEVAFD